MNRPADLNAALSFVTDRVNEQAAQSGEPLNAQQSWLRANLPSSPRAIWLPGPNIPGAPLVPRDITYERLCALAKNAYVNDHQIHPAAPDWDFAFAVFRLNRHPMWGILQRAGVKYPRPPWDSILLLIASLVFLALQVMLAFFVGISEEPWTRVQWIEFGLGNSALVALMYFGSRRLGRLQLQNEIEKCRDQCRL